VQAATRFMIIKLITKCPIIKLSQLSGLFLSLIYYNESSKVFFFNLSCIKQKKKNLYSFCYHFDVLDFYNKINAV